MPLYEQRTYSIHVGEMAKVVQLYSEEGFPVLASEGFAKHLIGYFVSDTGRLHQLIHLWRFADDEARRGHWKRLYASEAFGAFVVKLRPLIDRQEVQLLTAAPWGPRP